MALLTVQDQVALLLERQLAQDKAAGSQVASVEAAAVIETVTLNLFMNPQAAFYFAHLARNGPYEVVQDELDALHDTQQTVQDLGNPSFAIKDVSALQRARMSLIQIEGQGRLTTASGSFKNFESAVDEFLNKQLAKNVRRPGVGDLLRPSVEASNDLPGDFANLKSLHSDMLARLGYLTGGIRSFAASTATSVLGLNTAYRVRQDIEAILEELAGDPQATNSREYVIRLVAARATLRVLASPPSLFDPPSPLSGMWNGIQGDLDHFISTFRLSGFSTDLAKIDTFIAPLYGSPTPARRNMALTALSDLEAQLSSLLDLLGKNPLPAGSDDQESVADGILATLQERKYDRAADFLLQCRLSEVLSMDWQTVSYGGELMAAMSDLAQKDLVWPSADAEVVPVDNTPRGVL